jgi:hypothetical protein
MVGQQRFEARQNSRKNGSVTFLAAKAFAAAKKKMFRLVAFKTFIFWRGLAAFGPPGN